MELDVTELVTRHDMSDFAASAAELGPDAARITWQNACEIELEVPLVTRENEQDVIDHFAEYGAWSRTELRAMADKWELAALLVQDVAGDFREYGIDGEGRLHRGDDGRVFFYIGI